MGRHWGSDQVPSEESAMSLPLATRGYLCPQRGIEEFGPGPSIVSIEAQHPELLGASLDVPEGPTLTGAALQAPQIDSGAAAQSPPAADAPVISGGQIQAPSIDGSEED
jgi:hypothetical protein